MNNGESRILAPWRLPDGNWLVIGIGGRLLPHGYVETRSSITCSGDRLVGTNRSAQLTREMGRVGDRTADFRRASRQREEDPIGVGRDIEFGVKEMCLVVRGVWKGVPNRFPQPKAKVWGPGTSCQVRAQQAISSPSLLGACMGHSYARGSQEGHRAVGRGARFHLESQPGPDTTTPIRHLTR